MFNDLFILLFCVCVFRCAFTDMHSFICVLSQKRALETLFYHSLTLHQHLFLNLGLSFSQLSYKPASPSAPPSLRRDEIIGIYKTHSS